MEQGLVPDTWMDRRVVLLEQEQARTAAYEEPNYQWNFQAAVSCPPSTIIHMRGGQMWGDPELMSGTKWYVDSASYDLADEDDTGYTYIFTNAYYYLPVAVMLRWSGNPDIIDPAIDEPLYFLAATEQATAEGAENALYYPLASGTFVADMYYGTCLGLFVLRNNGNTGVANQFQPVDNVNRGRSYLWRQVKMRYQW